MEVATTWYCETCKTTVKLKYKGRHMESKSHERAGHLAWTASEFMKMEDAAHERALRMEKEKKDTLQATAEPTLNQAAASQPPAPAPVQPPPNSARFQAMSVVSPASQP